MKKLLIFFLLHFFVINLAFVGTVNAEDIEKLLNELKSDDALKQEHAYEKLSQLKDPNTIPHLIDMCHSKTAGWDLAYDLLIEIGEPAVNSLITAIISDRENQLIFFTILSSIGKPAVIPLIEILEKESKQVQHLSKGEEIKSLVSGKHPYDEDPHYINFNHILSCLQDIGTPSIPYLEKFIKTCDNRRLSDSVKSTINSIRLSP